MRPLLQRLLTLLLLSLAIFAGTRGLIRALPGDPIETLIAETGTTIPLETLRAELHLDQPYWVALRHDLRAALRGDLGRSLISKQPIAPVLGRRMARTAELAGLALALAAALSLWLGLAAQLGSRAGRAADRFCTYYGALVAALPTPWIGPLLILIFCLWIPLFPIGNHPALPALTLALSHTGFWSRLIRDRVRETLRFGSAPGARARGVPEWRVLLKYGLAPSSGSLLAFLGTQLGGLMAGAFVTEVIFDWRGMGSFLIEAVIKRDYPAVEAATFVAATFCLLGTALGDALQSWMDPRIDAGARSG